MNTERMPQRGLRWAACRRAGAALCLGTTMLLGCGRGSAVVHEALRAASPARAAGVEPCLTVARQFGDALRNERWPEAYEMCSASFRAEHPFEQFAAEMRAAVKEYHQFGPPLRCDANLEDDDPQSIAESFALPPRMQAEKPRAWVCDYMILEVERAADGEEYVRRSYEINLVLIDDQGHCKISFVKFAWSD